MSETTSVTTHEKEAFDSGINTKEETLSTTENGFSTSNNSHLNVEKSKVANISSEQTSITGNDPIADEKAEAVAAEEPSPRDIHGAKWFLVVVAILSSIFLFSLDNTVVADIQPAVVETFGSVNKLPWIAVAFLLAACSTNLIFGKIYGQFNAKWSYIICVFIFEGGSAICGAAQSMNMLIVGRAICGLGGVGMYVGVMTLLSVTTSIQERPMYIGSTGLMWGLGTVLGPVVGGAFTDSSAGWRWAFYINLCIGGVFAPVYFFMLPSFDPRPGVTYRARLQEMDFVGTILYIGAFVSSIMAVSFGGVLYTWGSGKTIALFVVAAVLFVVFGVQQFMTIFTTKERRIFPVEFLGNKAMIILFASISCAAASMVVPLYMIPLFFQFTRNDNALEAAVRLLPYICLMVFACIANGAILSIHGLYMPWYFAGGILIIIGSALMFTVDTVTSTSAVYGYTSLIGLGTGMFVQASFSVAQALVTPQEIPIAVGFITCGQITGITIALAVANAIFLNKAEGGLEKLLPQTPVDQIQGAIAGVGSSFVKNLPHDTREEVLKVIVKAMSKTYIGVIAAGSLAVILSLFMKRERLFLAAPAAS